LLKQFAWNRVLTLCLLLSGGLVLLAIPLASQVSEAAITGWGNAPLAAFVFPLIGLFLAPVYPAINSRILSSLPKHQHGLMSGLIIIFSALGGTTGSIITGNIFGLLGGQKAFYFSLIPIHRFLKPCKKKAFSRIPSFSRIVVPGLRQRKSCMLMSK
jgi:fucose permease